MEPSALNISDPVSSQIDDNYVSIKAEPVNDTLEDMAAMSSNQSLIENMTDGGFQHDVPLMRAGQQDFPLLRPDNIPVSPGGKYRKFQSELHHEKICPLFSHGTATILISVLKE